MKHSRDPADKASNGCPKRSVRVTGSAPSKTWGASLALWSWMSLTACGSAVQSTYLYPGYDASTSAATKRIKVLAWAPPEYQDLGTLLAQVASDRLKLKSSYLVHGAEPMERGWSDACNELEGVLSVRSLHVDRSPGEDVRLHLVAELHRCSDGALLWRAEGQEGNAAENEDLAELTRSYVNNLGEGAAPFAVPAFLVLRDLLDALPDVTLTDEEILEKIDLE